MRTSQILPTTLRTSRFLMRHPVGGRRPIDTFKRYIQWQLTRFTALGPIIAPLVDGARLVVAPGEHGATGSVYVGLTEFADMSFFVHALRKDDFFIDGGANVGVYTILGGAVAGARGLSVEPVPATYDRLLDNIGLNRLGDRVRAENVGLADRDGELRFTAALGAMNHVALNDEPSVAVPVRTLDGLVGDERPSLMKLDVEGYEGKVLMGAKGVMSCLDALIIENVGHTERYGQKSDEIDKRIRDFGFTRVAYEPESRELRTNDLPSDRGNSIYVRSVEQMRERVTNAPPFVVRGWQV